MPTGQKLTELQLAGLKKLFFSNPEKPDEDIATMAGCSVPTLRRYARKHGWRQTREAAQVAVGDVINQSISIGGQSVDFNALLLSAIASLAEGAGEAPVKSQEQALRTMGGLIELHRKLYPASMRECVQLLLSAPDYDRGGLVAIVRELRSISNQHPSPNWQPTSTTPNPPQAN